MNILKHCFTPKVKHWFIPLAHQRDENQQMLDGKELARRIREAMDTATPKVKSSTVADQCKVTSQAVNGWRKTGRVAKGHLPTIARLTRRPLEYFLGEEHRERQDRLELDPDAVRPLLDNIRRNLEALELMVRPHASTSHVEQNGYKKVHLSEPIGPDRQNKKEKEKR